MRESRFEGSKGGEHACIQLVFWLVGEGGCKGTWSFGALRSYHGVPLSSYCRFLVGDSGT